MPLLLNRQKVFKMCRVKDPENLPECLQEYAAAQYPESDKNARLNFAISLSLLCGYGSLAEGEQEAPCERIARTWMECGGYGNNNDEVSGTLTVCIVNFLKVWWLETPEQAVNHLVIDTASGKVLTELIMKLAS